jgi:hypothetical protein
MVGPSAGTGEDLYGGTDGGACTFDFTARHFANTSAGLVSGIDFFGAASSATNELSGAQDLGVDAYRGGATALDLYNSDGFGIVLIDQSNPASYYAAVSGLSPAFIVSHNAGVRWKVIHLSPAVTESYYMRPVQASDDPSVIILPESNGILHISSNAGSTWHAARLRALNGDYVTIVRAALIQGTSTPVIYAGTGFGRVWRSGNLGQTWTKLRHAFPLTVRDLVIDAAGSTGPSGEHVFVALGVYSPVAYATSGSYGDVQVTTNSGLAWTDIGAALSTSSVNAIMLSGSTVLVGTDHGVQQYSGTSWLPAGTGFAMCASTDSSSVRMGRRSSPQRGAGEPSWPRVPSRSTELCATRRSG